MDVIVFCDPSVEQYASDLCADICSNLKADAELFHYKSYHSKENFRKLLDENILLYRVGLAVISWETTKDELGEILDRFIELKIPFAVYVLGYLRYVPPYRWKYLKAAEHVVENTIWHFVPKNDKRLFDVLREMLNPPEKESFIAKNGILCRYIGSKSHVTVPDGISVIGNYAFVDNRSLVSVTLPADTVAIGRFAFASCDKLEEITVSEGLASIGQYAFASCVRLQAFRTAPVPAGYTPPPSTVLALENERELGKNAFEACRSLQHVSIPRGIRVIKKNAFKGCTTAFTAVHLSTGLEVIGAGAFKGCKGLVDINIPEGVTVIDDCAFHCCTALTSISLPASLTRTELEDYYSNDPAFGALDSALSHCKSLAEINVAEGNAFYQSIDGILYTKGGDRLLRYPQGKTDSTYMVPSVTTAIVSNAFDSNPYLKHIVIHGGVNDIKTDGFYGLTALKTITVAKENPCFCSADGMLFSKDKDTLLVCPLCGISEEYTVPNGVKLIDENAFGNNVILKRLHLPSGIRCVGRNTLNRCDSLTHISFADEVDLYFVSLGNTTPYKRAFLYGTLTGCNKQSLQMLCEEIVEELHRYLDEAVEKENPQILLRLLTATAVAKGVDVAPVNDVRALLKQIAKHRNAQLNAVLLNYIKAYYPEAYKNMYSL